MPGDRAGANTPSVVDWELGAEMLIDTEALNAKYAARAHTNERIKGGFFRAPRNVSRPVLEQGVHESIKKFVETMGKRGWELTSKVELTGPFTARDPNDTVLLDMAEFRVRGVFKFTNKVEQRRVYLPTGLIKQDPEHSVRVGGSHSDLADIVKNI